ncbi:MAG: DNA mismatch repair endonuclease MutL, partial [Aquificaceae bacterium]|nr:DNA mismatch repair endonuclease MutL [Aquificaceae bacterium]
MRINLLPEEVKSHISSGEVIDGPAECLKELLENSIDANATRIEVEILKGGKRYICVKDNGYGIPSEDLPKAIMSGATSKIRTLEDLQNLNTYGYRGEALHAISLVSRMVIRSRFYQEETGRELRIEGGKVIAQREVGMPVGTQVEVYDLFYNVPVRRSFLGSEDKERRRIYRVFKELALANPHIAFRLEAEGREVFNIKPAKDLRDRSEDVLRQKMEYISLEDPPVRVELILSLEKGKRESYLFVNGRPVQNKKLIEHLKTYGGITVCHLQIPPYLVDVNVHPKKTEVKIHLEGRVRELLKKAFNLRHKHSLPTLAQEKPEYSLEPEFIGIIDNTIIVAKYGDYLYFFDQHLLSESYNYEFKGLNEDKACRVSIKAGERLSVQTARELLRWWVQLKNKESCPHGRTLYYRVYLGELYKKLGRVY